VEVVQDHGSAQEGDSTLTRRRVREELVLAGAAVVEEHPTEEQQVHARQRVGKLEDGRLVAPEHWLGWARHLMFGHFATTASGL
jgi:hypothetical protein